MLVTMRFIVTLNLYHYEKFLIIIEIVTHANYTTHKTVLCTAYHTNIFRKIEEILFLIKSKYKSLNFERDFEYYERDKRPSN